MSSGAIAIIILVVLVIAAGGVAAFAVITRRRRLQHQFGSEYDRTVTEQHGRLRAEAELTDRRRRVRKLDIRPLPEEARLRYRADWEVIQEQFVDAPQTAVARACDLVVTVMKERGYPTGDTEQVMSDLSVEHAETVGHFRAAQQITTAAAADGVQTEDLRQALIHYRALFSDLLGGSTADHMTEPASTGNSAAEEARDIPA